MLRLRISKIDRDGNVTKTVLEVPDVARAESEFLSECGSSYADDAMHGALYGPDPEEPGREACIRTFARPRGTFLWSADEGDRGLGLVYRPEGKTSQRDLFGGLA